MVCELHLNFQELELHWTFLSLWFIGQRKPEEERKWHHDNASLDQTRHAVHFTGHVSVLPTSEWHRRGKGGQRADQENKRRMCHDRMECANSFSISIWTDQLLDKIQESWTWPGRKCYHRMTGKAKSWFYVHTHTHTLLSVGVHI